MADTNIDTILGNNCVIIEEKTMLGSPLRMKKVRSNDSGEAIANNVNEDMKQEEISDELRQKIDEVIYKCVKDNKIHMGDSGMRYFCSKLQQQPKQQMSQVKDIDLQSIYNQFYNLANDLTSHGINIFCNSLPLFPNLERLEIGINPIELSGIRELSYYLHLIPKLQKLGLGGCNIGDNGIEQLSSYFKDISQLELLNIQNNGITDKGVEIFCKYIDNLPKLFELSLQENELSNNGIELVGESIMKCMELQVLSYYDNKMNNGEDVRFEIRQNHPNKEMCIYVYEDEIHAELDKEVEDTLRGLE